MARHDGEFEAAGEATLDVRELLKALAGPTVAAAGERRESIAQCLAGQEGWRDAASRLGGAFAAPFPATGLTDGKE